MKFKEIQKIKAMILEYNNYWCVVNSFEKFETELEAYERAMKTYRAGRDGKGTVSISAIKTAALKWKKQLKDLDLQPKSTK